MRGKGLDIFGIFMLPFEKKVIYIVLHIRSCGKVKVNLLVVFSISKDTGTLLLDSYYSKFDTVIAPRR